MATKSNFECFVCQTEDVSVECTNCDGPFCKNCDEKVHNNPSHPNRQKHIRKAIASSSFAQCNSCGSDNVEYFCTNCEEQQLFCTTCDHLFHEQQDRQGHVRKQFRHLSHLTVDDGIHCCNCHIICTVKCNDCSECNKKYHDYPHLKEHTRKELKRVCSICEEITITVRCDEYTGWYCDESRHKKLASHIRKQIQEKSPKGGIMCGLEGQIKEFTKSIEEYKTALEQLKVKKDSILHQKETQIQALENNFKSLQDRHELEKVHNREIQTMESLIQEHISKARRKKEQTDSIVHHKEVQIQALENNFKSLQDRHEMEKVQHNREIQTKDSLIQEQATRQKEQTESLENENRDLQEQIKTMSHKEGTWKKYSGGDVPVDEVVSDEGYKYYVARLEVDGDVVPGWIYPHHNVCHVFHNGNQRHNSPYEVTKSVLLQQTC